MIGLYCWAMVSKGRDRLRSFAVAAATTVIAIWYALVVAGIPLPAPLQHFTERFPCEACHCGCATAEYCWSNCCCHTLAERLAWAEREGVEPPKFVKALLNEQKRLPACCSKRLAAQKNATKRGEISDCGGTCCSRKRVAAEPPDAADSNYILGWKALACQGIGVEFTAAVPAIPVVACSMPDVPLCIEWLSCVNTITLPGVCYAPIVPPPECLSI